MVWQVRRGEASIGVTVSVSPRSTDSVMIVFETPTDQEIAQVNAFHWINEAYEFYNQVLPRSSSKVEMVHVIVNDNDVDSCYLVVPKELHLERNLKKRHSIFQPTNGSCSDVILHEYAHAIDSMTPEGEKETDEEQRRSDDEFAKLCYAEGFADAFVILYKQELFVGEDLLGPGKHARDYRSARSTVTIDGKTQAACLKWGDQQFESYFMQNYGDGQSHFGGRIFPLFLADLVQRLEKCPGFDKKTAYSTVTHMVLAADTFNPPHIPGAVQIIQELLRRNTTLPYETKACLFDQVKAAATDLEIPHDKTPL